MPRESHQNEVGRSHRSVAFYLRSSRNIALTKIHFKYLGLYSLEKEHKIAKINLGLSHRPCFDDSFPGPERELGIMHSVYVVYAFIFSQIKFQTILHAMTCITRTADQFENCI